MCRYRYVAIAMSLRRIMFRPKFNALLYKTFNLYITLILVSNSLNVSFQGLACLAECIIYIKLQTLFAYFTMGHHGRKFRWQRMPFLLGHFTFNISKLQFYRDTDARLTKFINKINKTNSIVLRNKNWLKGMMVLLNLRTLMSHKTLPTQTSREILKTSEFQAVPKSETDILSVQF